MRITTHPNDIKERLSVAYLFAVAARAGCQVTNWAIDKQSVDATVKPIRGSKLTIDLQLKATSENAISGQSVVFDLPVNNYDALRDEHCTAPHYLVVLLLEQDEARWLETSHEALLIRRCAYWCDLRGKPATSNTQTIRVELPREQAFDVAALHGMMQDAHALIRPRKGGGT